MIPDIIDISSFYLCRAVYWSESLWWTRVGSEESRDLTRSSLLY